MPVRILYGDADDVVAPHLSTDLAARVGNLQDLVVVPGAGHDDRRLTSAPYAVGAADPDRVSTRGWTRTQAPRS